MSDVMLVNPSSKKILNNGGDRPPLGILYLANVLRNRGHRVRVRDMDHLSLEELCSEVSNDKPECMGISVYTSPLYKEAVEIAKMFRDLKLIAGGYHASALPETLEEHFDAVICGEGEVVFPIVIEEDLTGIINAGNMKIDDIPEPARDLIDLKKYGYKQNDKPATTLISSRGCPNSCAFCGNINRCVRFNPVERVIKEIKGLKDLGYNDFYFYDDNFITSKQRNRQLLEEIAKLNINYRITTRARTISDETANQLRDSGCTWVSLGIESGSDERLRDVDKNQTVRDNLNAVNILSRRGITTKGFFMFGLPNESIEDALKTIRFSKVLKDVGMSYADFYIMTPFPGTPIWSHPSRYGIEIFDRDYTKYLEAGKNPPRAFHRTKYMQPEDIEYMRNKAEIEWRNH